MTHLLLSYGLVLLFLLVAAEGMGVPLPGETTVIAAAVLSSEGRFPVEEVIAVAAAGAIAGDNAGYWIGRLGGRRLLERVPLLRRTLGRILPVAERFFLQHGAKTVLVARFVALLRITVAWLAGISRMTWPRFFAFDAAGAALWATAVTLVAYVFGRAAAAAISRYGLYGVVGIVACAILGFALFRFWRKRLYGRAGEMPD